MTKAAATGREAGSIEDAGQERREGAHRAKESKNVAYNVERVGEGSEQPCRDSNSGVLGEGRIGTTTAAATDSTTGEKEWSNPADSSTPQREQRGQQREEGEKQGKTRRSVEGEERDRKNARAGTGHDGRTAMDSRAARGSEGEGGRKESHTEEQKVKW